MSEMERALMKLIKWEAKFGPQKGTPINTFAAMKSGMRSVDSTGRCGPISSSKAQKHLDEYIAAVRRIEGPHEEDGDMEVDEHEVEQEQYLNGKALYEVSSGGPRKHGHLAITYGAVRFSDVRAARRERSVRPSNSMAREMEELRRTNGRLQQENCEKDNALQRNKVLVDLILELYRDSGKTVPEEALQHLSAAQGIATGCSNAFSESANNANGAGHTNGDLHAANVANNQGSDNNGDHELM